MHPIGFKKLEKEMTNERLLTKVSVIRVGIAYAWRILCGWLYV